MAAADPGTTDPKGWCSRPRAGLRSRTKAVHAERAVQLAFDKYCSVAASLAPDIVVTTMVELNGEKGEPARQRIFTPAE